MGEKKTLIRTSSSCSWNRVRSPTSPHLPILKPLIHSHLSPVPISCFNHLSHPTNLVTPLVGFFASSFHSRLSSFCFWKDRLCIYILTIVWLIIIALVSILHFTVHLHLTIGRFLHPKSPHQLTSNLKRSHSISNRHLISTSQIMASPRIHHRVAIIGSGNW